MPQSRSMRFAMPHDKEDRAYRHGAGQEHLPGQHLAPQQPAQKDADDRHHIFIGNGRGDGYILQQPEIAGIGDDRATGAHPGKGHDHRPVDIFIADRMMLAIQKSDHKTFQAAHKDEQRARLQTGKPRLERKTAGQQGSGHPAER